MRKDSQSAVANTPVPDEFKRKPRTISPDPVLWRRLEEAATARRVPTIRLVDQAVKELLDRMEEK